MAIRRTLKIVAWTAGCSVVALVPLYFLLPDGG